MQSTLEADAVGLAAAVATRLCHDVAGLLGTLAGTLAMADEEPEARVLAAETAQTLIARVRLLRAAWGGGAGALDAAALAEFAEGLPGIERLRLDLSGLPGELEEAPARLTLCLLLAALPGMPRGGTIRLTAAEDGGVRVSLEGPGAAWPEGLVDCASSEAACWREAAAPRGLAAPVVCLMARASGWRVCPEGAAVELRRR